MSVCVHVWANMSACAHQCACVWSLCECVSAYENVKIWEPLIMQLCECYVCASEYVCVHFCMCVTECFQVPTCVHVCANMSARECENVQVYTNECECVSVCPCPYVQMWVHKCECVELCMSDWVSVQDEEVWIFPESALATALCTRSWPQFPFIWAIIPSTELSFRSCWWL